MAQIAIRPVTEQDYDALSHVYGHTVRKLGPDRYSSDQIEAWAMYSKDHAAFHDFVFGCYTIVAELDGRIAGFSGIASDGHVVSLYVHGDCTRMGVGSKLLEAVMEYARFNRMPRLYTEASKFSHELFGRFGFTVDEEETVIRNGVAFDRYKMSLQLDSSLPL
ncbi:MAG: hypothetical protein AMXMBFR84_40230 [Candidatus Hydrogenedentota bacterium]